MTWICSTFHSERIPREFEFLMIIFEYFLDNLQRWDISLPDLLWCGELLLLGVDLQPLLRLVAGCVLASAAYFICWYFQHWCPIVFQFVKINLFLLGTSVFDQCLDLFSVDFVLEFLLCLLWLSLTAHALFAAVVVMGTRYHRKVLPASFRLPYILRLEILLDEFVHLRFRLLALLLQPEQSEPFRFFLAQPFSVHILYENAGVNRPLEVFSHAVKCLVVQFQNNFCPFLFIYLIDPFSFHEFLYWIGSILHDLGVCLVISPSPLNLFDCVQVSKLLTFELLWKPIFPVLFIMILNLQRCFVHFDVDLARFPYFLQFLRRSIYQYRVVKIHEHRILGFQFIQNEKALVYVVLHFEELLFFQ